MRRPLVAGNWKMNLTAPAARQLVDGLRRALPSAEQAVEVVVCPSFVHLFPVAEALKGSPIALGAQDLYYEPAGAFTGEVAPAMVAETGARYVILGHSERRHTIGHHEDDWMINQKIKAARAAGLTPILCLGETLAQREANQTFDVLTFQLIAGLVGVWIERPADLVLAYEPVWAIGTGRNATAEQAQEAHRHLREGLHGVLGGVADEIRILYGGSVKPENARAIMAKPDVDGGLIGGASLKADAFLGIINETLAAKK